MTNLLLKAVMAVVITLVLTALAGAQEPGNARHGFDLAATQCARCHATRAGETASPLSGLASFQTIAAGRMGDEPQLEFLAAGISGLRGAHAARHAPTPRG